MFVDASEENSGYSSSEDPVNSDTEEEAGRKLVSRSPGFQRAATSRVLYRLTLPVFVNPLGSGEVHGNSRLREGRTSGAVRQERRRGPADPRRRGRTVVSLSAQEEEEEERWFT